MIYILKKNNDKTDGIFLFTVLDKDILDILNLYENNMIKVILGRLILSSFMIGPILSKLHKFESLLTILDDDIHCSVSTISNKLYYSIDLINSVEERVIEVDGNLKYDVEHYLAGAYIIISITGLGNVVVQKTFKMVQGGICADIVDLIQDPCKTIWGNNCSITGGGGVALENNKVFNACGFIVLDFTPDKKYTSTIKKCKELQILSRYLFSPNDFLRMTKIPTDGIVLEKEIKIDPLIITKEVL